MTSRRVATIALVPALCLGLTGIATASPPGVRQTETRSAAQARRWCGHTTNCVASSESCVKRGGPVECREVIELQPPEGYLFECLRISSWTDTPDGHIRPRYDFRYCAEAGD